MTDEDTEPETDEPEPDEDEDEDEESDRVLTLKSLDEKVDRLAEAVNKFLTGGGRPGTRQTAADEAEQRRQEVREELGNLRTQEKKDSAFSALQTKVRKIEKVMAESVPRELRGVEKIMGWHRE